MVRLFYLALDSLGVDNLRIVIGLTILSYQDIKYGEIHYRYLLLMVGFSYLSGYVLLVVCIVFYKYFRSYIGGADLLIFCLIVTHYGYQGLSYVILVASTLALIYSCLFKKRVVRFIPFILVGALHYIGGII